MVFCNIGENHEIIRLLKSHNPYFNRWFSAIELLDLLFTETNGHNPYFNRWFSAMIYRENCKELNRVVTILILIDGFLQS